MKKWKSWMASVLICGLLAGEVAVIADYTAAWHGRALSVSLFAVLTAALALVFFLLTQSEWKGLLVTAVAAHVMAALFLTAGWLGWRNFSENGGYADADTGKRQLYAGQKVMLIVPHQDDDINVLGGVMEEYVKYGSQLYPVFVTNGDAEVPSQTRFREALDMFAGIGVPGENIIFLGYGDTWKEDGPHLYNAQPGQVMESFAGKTATYGTEAAPVFRVGRAYTVDNLLEDLQDVILTCRPDVIFCSDYDSHIDHKAVTLAFEKVMGRILKQERDYAPLVFKGYAYKTAWFADADFFETNILSTQNVFADPYWQKPEVYRWEDRVRLPVNPATLSRSVFSAGGYRSLAAYESQSAHLHAAGILNGDKVFWQRETDSLCLNAEIAATSGNAALLNDFMLLENNQLTDALHMPYDGAWVPEANDEEKTVSVTLGRTSNLERIVLYDNPSETDNVLNAVIVLENGFEIQTGPLNPGGAATEVPLKRAITGSFTVQILETEGDRAGLTEIEAFEREKSGGNPYIKLMDEAGQFVYDYWMDPSGEETFRLYVRGMGSEPSAYTVSVDNARCQAIWEESRLCVNCPVGETAVITVSAVDGVSDSITVRNPGKLERAACGVFQKIEKNVLHGLREGFQWTTATYKLINAASHILGK